MSEIVKFDPTKTVDAIREKIRNAMFEVIPQEQWDAMIKQEVESFFKPSARYDSYNQRRIEDGPSPFTVIVHKELEEDVKGQVKKVLQSPEWSTNEWDYSGSGPARMKVSEAVTKYINENTGAIINAWVGQLVQQVILNMGHR